MENSGFFADMADEDAGDADDPQSAPIRAFIQSIAPSPLDANLIWIGTSSGLIQVTHDGATWSDVSPLGSS